MNLNQALQVTLAPIHYKIRKELSYSADKKLFVGDASDFLGTTHRFLFGQLYPDACDEGLVLVSEKTGQHTMWYVTERKHDAENDTIWWKLLPTVETIRACPILKDHTLIIHND